MFNAPQLVSGPTEAPRSFTALTIIWRLGDDFEQYPGLDFIRSEAQQIGSDLRFGPAAVHYA